MFAWHLVFCLFKCIASNERDEKRFLNQASFMVFCSFPKREQISVTALTRT